MGAQNSVLEDQLGNITLEDLQKVFESLATKGPNGERTLSKAAFQKQFPKAANKDVFGKTLFEIFDVDGSGRIDFGEFSVGILLLTQGSVDKKAEALFRILDSNSDNYVDEDELRVFAEKVIGSVKKLSEYLDPEHYESLSHGGKLATDVDSFLDEAFSFIRHNDAARARGDAEGNLSPAHAAAAGVKFSFGLDSAAANTDAETRLLKKAATLTRDEAAALKDAAVAGRTSGASSPVTADDAAATPADAVGAATVPSLSSGPRPKARMSSLEFRQWASSSPQMHLLIDRAFSINPEQQICEDVKKAFVANLTSELKTQLPLDKAEVCRLHGGIAQYWLEILDKRLAMHRQARAVLQMPEATGAGVAATPVKGKGGKDDGKQAAQQPQQQSQLNYVTPAKEGGPRVGRRTSLAALTDDVSDINSPSLAGVTGASLKTTRYNAALQTGKGDDSATIAYYIRYLSLDRILEENTQISERICDALAAQVMQRVAAQLPTINGDWVHAYTTILWTELDSGYITNQQAKGPMKSATLLAALRVHVPAHTQIILEACVKTVDASVRADMTKKLEESLKDRIAAADAAERRARDAAATSEKFKRANEERTKELEAKSQAHDAQVGELSAQLQARTEELDVAKQRLELAQSEVLQAIETKRAAVETLADELRAHAKEKSHWSDQLAEGSLLIAKLRLQAEAQAVEIARMKEEQGGANCCVVM